MAKEYHRGDCVVYCKTKFSEHPGPRAKQIHPAAGGDTYNYCVDKFWVVVNVEGDQVHVQTPGGKVHTLPTADPCLRKASWWERWWYRNRFQQARANMPASQE